MNLRRFILFSVFALCNIGRSETTNSFGIYLTTELLDDRILISGKGDWSHIRLSETPLISAADIISFDFANQSITLKPDAMARIGQPPVRGTPFVVVVDGQRIYLGAFVTSISSMPFAVPSIIVDPLGRSRVQNWDWSHWEWSLIPNQPTNTLVIGRAYPSASFGVGPDPRRDERIKSALKALHKLRNDE